MGTGKAATSFLLAIGMAASAAPPVPSPVAGWLADAKATAESRYGKTLYLDGRDADVLPSIVIRVHEDNSRQALSREALQVEVRRWGAVCSEVVRGMYVRCRWSEAKERNRKYGFSVQVPIEGGYWSEDNCFDLVEGLITKPALESDLSIEQVLRLHFLD